MTRGAKYYTPRAIRLYKDDDTVINVADKIDQMSSRLDGDLTVQLSGSIVTQDGESLKVQEMGREVVTILPRTLRSTGTYLDVDIPRWAKGMQVIACIYGATGTFASGEGINVRVRNSLPLSGSNALTLGLLQDVKSDKYTGGTNTNTGCIIHPDVKSVSSTFSSVRNFNIKAVESLLLGRKSRVEVEINGTFSAGQGFDLEIYAVFM